MVKTKNVDGEHATRLKGIRRAEESTKYTRYTQEQLGVLERIYAICQNPDRFHRARLMREEPLLNGVDNKHLKVWFQNRRCRERQKKENEDLQAENRRLNAMNKALRTENDSLLKQVGQLICENENLRNQVLNSASTTTIMERGPVTEADISPRISTRNTDNYDGIVSLAKEIKEEFLSKAHGSTINWIPISVAKVMPSPCIVGAIYISASGVGLAAKTCAMVQADPIKAIELLKDRVSWGRNCRNLDVLAKYAVENGGTIELIYTQYYAHTTMACARDFWTLRYTSLSQDGGFVVCEKSISGSDVVPSSPASLEFVRSKMLASGYLITPCEGGSRIHLISHLDLESSFVPEIIRPLFESSEFLAHKMIVPAIQYVEHVATHPIEVPKLYPYHRRLSPHSVRNMSHRLSRGFNDAINGFSEDGWSLMNADATDNIIISIKQAANVVDAKYDSIICIKASFIVQNVLPSKVVRLLKERRGDWMGYSFSENAQVFSRAVWFTFPGLKTHTLNESSVPLAKPNDEGEVLAVTRFQRIDKPGFNQFGDLCHMEISNGTEDNNFGPCSELIFAPIYRKMPDGSPYSSSGFRIISLGPKSIEGEGTSASANLTSMMIMAFQFPVQTHLQDEAIAMARQYVQHIISTMSSHMSIEITLPAGSSAPAIINLAETFPAMEIDIPDDSNYELDLANRICQSYRSALGVDEMFGLNAQNISPLEMIQNHQHPILCFSVMSSSECLYANQAGLNMLQTTVDNLQSLSLTKILNGSNNVLFDSILSTLMKQHYVTLPPGYCLSLMSNCISYEQMVVWLVVDGSGSPMCFATAFTNWSFV